MTTTAQAPCDHQPGVPTENHPARDQVCVRCGRQLPSRDQEFEAAFFADVKAVLSGVNWNDAETDKFTRLVRERLEMGERVYGNAWATRENMPEAHQEPPDAAAYPLLELQRRKDDVHPDAWAEARHEFVIAAALAARVAHHLRVGERKLNGE